MNVMTAFCEALKFTLLLWALGINSVHVLLAFLMLVTLVETLQNWLIDIKYESDDALEPEPTEGKSKGASA